MVLITSNLNWEAVNRMNKQKNTHDNRNKRISAQVKDVANEYGK